MTPETWDYLRRARVEIEEAQITVSAGLGKAAARAAYYAMFNVAEALIFDRNGKVAKTHAGVRNEFARLTMNASPPIRRLASVLNDAYGFKELGDYGTAEQKNISVDKASELIVEAKKFSRLIEELLA